MSLLGTFIFIISICIVIYIAWYIIKKRNNVIYSKCDPNDYCKSHLQKQNNRNLKICKTIAFHPEKMKKHLLNFFPLDEVNSLSSKNLRVAFLRSALWPQNSIIKIGFVQDNYYSKSKKEWVIDNVNKYLKPHINLNFEWDVDIKDADVRITFNPDNGAYSAIGTECKFSENVETMNLGWLDTKDDYDFEEAKGSAAVVIHEFGHALGMIHEHSREDALLPWDCKKVYEDLSGAPNEWDCETIYNNVFKPVERGQLEASEYDPKSIMHYYFPNDYFMKDIDLPHNTELSKLDIEWLKKMYPRS